jgi:hypothetical protein
MTMPGDEYLDRLNAEIAAKRDRATEMLDRVSDQFLRDLIYRARRSLIDIETIFLPVLTSTRTDIVPVSIDFLLADAEHWIRQVEKTVEAFGDDVSMVVA